MPRTHIDFSQHEVLITKQEGLLIHHLKKLGTYVYSVKFINTNGIMAVTGDLGNWIFCREFHPSEEGGVSDGYWAEKLRISSEQESHEFSEEKTRRRIIEGLNESDNEEEKEYLNGCLEALDVGQWEYEQYAYNEQPSWYDSECVPHEKEIKHQLLVVFDAFDEICKRLKKDTGWSEEMKRARDNSLKNKKS